MTAGPAVGREPSTDDMRWLRAGEELEPHKSLARAADGARYVVTTVALLGSLVAGLGVFAVDRRTTPVVAVLGCASLAAASVAVVVALTAVVARGRRLAPEDIAAVRNWYGEELRRAARAGTAGVLLVVAVVLAAAAGGAQVAHTLRGGPSLALDVTTGAGGTVAHISAVADEGDHLHATLTCAGVVVAQSFGLAGQDGVVRLSFSTQATRGCVLRAGLYGRDARDLRRTASLP